MRLLRFRFLASLVLCSATLWLVFHAQAAEALPPGTTSLEALLYDSNAQDHLQFSKEQLQKAKDSCLRVRRKAKQALGNFRAPNAAMAAAKANEMMDQIKSDTEKELKAVLEAEPLRAL